MQDDVTEAVALLPCPFCGGEAMLYTWDFDKSEPQSFHVACTGCEGGFTPSYSRAEAIAAWNTRAAMPSRDAIEREAEARVVKWLRGEAADLANGSAYHRAQRDILLIQSDAIEARKHLTEQGEGV